MRSESSIFELAAASVREIFDSGCPLGLNSRQPWPVTPNPTRPQNGAYRESAGQYSTDLQGHCVASVCLLTQCYQLADGSLSSNVNPSTLAAEALLRANRSCRSRRETAFSPEPITGSCSEARLN